MFRMKVLNRLNGKQREEVRELEKLCRKQEEVWGGISLTPEEEGGFLRFYLTYDEDLLAGFAVMYALPENKAEICGYVHPQYRIRSMYKKLFVAIKKDTDRLEITESYMVHDPGGEDSFAIFDKEGYARYAYSEYLMEWKYSYRLLPTNMISLMPLAEEQQESAAELLCAVFPMEISEVKKRIQDVRADGGRFFGAWKQKELVGVFGLSYGKDAVYLFDFAVHGDFQRRGFGKAMLKELIRMVQEETAEGAAPKKIRLQVGSDNEAAFRIYQKNGFQIVSQRDYYRLMFSGG